MAATVKGLIEEGEDNRGRSRGRLAVKVAKTIKADLVRWYSRITERYRQPCKTIDEDEILKVHRNMLLETFHSIEAAFQLPEA